VNHIDIALAARAFEGRRAVRAARVRHRRLVENPLAVAIWQLGAEAFSASALGWGDRHNNREMAVAGEPRNRDLAFAALLKFAKWFNPKFEAHAADRETIITKKREIKIARTAPQVIVANGATAALLGRLGRRLAYLPTDGDRPAPIELVRLGRHLLFLWDRFSFPGQSLVVAMTELMNTHWATPQSALERQSLPALDAFVDPPAGGDGFVAAALAELSPVGPVPEGADDRLLIPLVDAFNTARAGRTEPQVVAPLLQPIVAHYRPLLLRTWDLLWRCRDREALLPEAPSVGRRWDADRYAYTRHMDWMARSGLRRTRQTPRQAVYTLRDLEEAGRRVGAEEACDDPLRMAAYVLSNKAVRGTVIAVDPTHTEPGPKNRVRRPLVTLRSPDPCLIPLGRELWWVEAADGREYVVEDVLPTASGGSDVVLKLMTGSGGTALPALGTAACFSIHNTSPEWLGDLPDEDPWTHCPAVAALVPAPIEGPIPEALEWPSTRPVRSIRTQLPRPMTSPNVRLPTSSPRHSAARLCCALLRGRVRPIGSPKRWTELARGACASRSPHPPTSRRSASSARLRTGSAGAKRSRSCPPRT